MQSTFHAADPFGQLIDPQAVQRALEGSQRLECLNRRICRPLDRTVVPKPAGEDSVAYDAAIEQDYSLPLED
jgi:hypothetical protein